MYKDNLYYCSLSKLSRATGIEVSKLRARANRKGKRINKINADDLNEYLESKGIDIGEINFEDVRRTYGVVEIPKVGEIYQISFLNSGRVEYVPVIYVSKTHVVFEEPDGKVHTMNYALWRRMRPYNISDNENIELDGEY